MSIIQKIRDKGALISAIIIALALLGFILTDYLSTRGGNPFGGSNSTTIGTIDGKKIDYVEFEKKVKSQEDIMQAQGQDLGDMGRQRIIQDVWDREINEAVMTKEFNKLGFSIGEKELNDILYGTNPPPDLKQRFTNEQGVYDVVQVQQAINQMKRNKDKTTRQQLEDYLQVVEFNRMMEKYSALVTNSIYYPKWLIEKQNAEASQMAKIAYVRYPYININDTTIKVSDAEIEEYLEKKKDQYKQEESRSITYVMFDAAPTAADSAANRGQLEALKEEFANATDPATFLARYGSGTPYEDRYVKQLGGSFADSIKNLPDNAVFGPYLEGPTYTITKMIGKKEVPDSAEVRHILIKMADRQAGQVRDDSTAKKLADSIMLAVAGGANFDSLVIKYSDDMGSKANGGKYTFSVNTSLVPEFYKTTFYEPAGTKKVVKGESPDYIGYHYIEVLSQEGFGTGYKVAHLSKPIYASEETERRANNEANTFAGGSQDLKSFDANFEKQLKPRGVQKLYAQNIKPNDYIIPGITGMARSLVRDIYEADKGETIQPQLIGDKYVVAVVTDIFEKGTQPVSIARTTVEPVLRNKKKAEIIKQRIGKISTLEAVSSALNLPIEPADSVRFIGSTPGIGFEPKVIGAAFNPANKGKVVPEPIEGSSAVYVLRVDDVTATSVIAGDITQQRQMMEAQARQRASGASDFMGGPQLPTFIQTLREIADIKDKRSQFY